LTVAWDVLLSVDFDQNMILLAETDSNQYSLHVLPKAMNGFTQWKYQKKTI